MKRLAVIVLVLSCVALSVGSAHARPSTHGLGSALGITSRAITLPPQWDGIWTTADSVYDCTAGFMSFVTGADTICGGQAYSQTIPGNPIDFTCTGTADATTIHATCTGTSEVFTDCHADYDVQVDMARTGSTYRSVVTITATYSGTAEGCSFVSCIRVVSYGTRTGPAPLNFCTTPVQRTSWGRLKMLYR